MSKVVPEPYYICDYCGKKFDDYHDIKYTDNSGLDEQVYDMCSDKCLSKHVQYLKKVAKDEKLTEEEFHEYLEEFLPVAINRIAVKEMAK